MKVLIKYFGLLFGAGVAAACCLGVPLVLSTLGTVGLGFIVHDAYLVPLFVGFVGLSVWTLYRSASRRARLGPFWLALTGGVTASFGLWLLVTGRYPHSWPLYAGLTLLVGGSVCVLINGRRDAACDFACDPKPSPAPDARRRALSGAAIATAAAGVFFGLYKSVDATKPRAEASDVACWGINACKGTTACSTAFNGCTGQNSCKGRGYLNVSAAKCKAKGGVPLAGSEADPAGG